MKLILFIILVAVVLIILLFNFAMKVKLVLNTDETNINATLLWLSPLLKAFITIEDTKPVLILYLFNKQVLKKTIKRGKSKHKAMDLVQLTDPQDVHVNVRYSFGNPFTTGIACGAINIASQFINIDSIDQTPDFVAANDYIYLDATAKVNLGSTLVKFLKQKNNR